MPNSNRGAGFGRRPGTGTVTVIEEPVRRNAARIAKIAACVTFVVVALLAATVAASFWQPVVALFAGVLIGVAAAFVVAAAVIAWPVLRALWWWATEIILVSAFIAGWVVLAGHTSLAWRIGAVALIVGIPAAVPAARRRVIATGWCVITRHRLRVCFSEFIITNRTGSLPLILWAHPTPVGERVWIWLRPGLALDDIQARLDLIAVACWATSVTAEAASASNSAHIRLDIKRRDALTATVRSPLLGVASPAPAAEREAQPVPSALDLPDVNAAEVAAPAKSPRAQPRAAAPVTAVKTTPAASPGDDIRDWV